MVPPLQSQKNHFFFIALLALGVILATIWAAFQGGCSDTDQRSQVDTEPCELVCISLDGCYGFDATELTFEDCMDSCQYSTAAENECYQDCDQIMDCDPWFNCILECDS